MSSLGETCPGHSREVSITITHIQIHREILLYCLPKSLHIINTVPNIQTLLHLHKEILRHYPIQIIVLLPFTNSCTMPFIHMHCTQPPPQYHWAWLLPAPKSTQVKSCLPTQRTKIFFHTQGAGRHDFLLMNIPAMENQGEKVKASQLSVPFLKHRNHAILSNVHVKT